MESSHAKNRQLERALSQLGALAATAADDLERIADNMVQLQSNIERIYMILGEPLALAEAEAEGK